MTHLPTTASLTLARAPQRTGTGTLCTAAMGSVLVVSALVFGLSAGQPAFAADKAGEPASTNAAPAPSGMMPRMAPGMAPGGPGGHGEHGGMGMMLGGRHLDRLLNEVKASDAQRAQIKQITDKARTDIQALHAQGKGLHERAMTLWTAPKLDAAEADKVRQQMLAQHDQVSKRMMQAMLDVGNVLTPEQRAKAAELVKAQRARMGERMGERMRDRMGERMEAHPGSPHEHGDRPAANR